MIVVAGVGDTQSASATSLHRRSLLRDADGHVAAVTVVASETRARMVTASPAFS